MTKNEKNKKESGLKIDFTEIINQRQIITKILTFLHKRKYIIQFPVNKSFGRYYLEFLLEDSQKNLEEYETKLNAFKLKNTILLANEVFAPFTMSRGASRAIELLNEVMYNKIFAPGTIPQNDVKLIFRIFFQLIKCPEISQIEDGSEFWTACSNYINTEGNGKTGTLITNDVKKFDFSVENIYKIHKIVEKDIGKIAPAYFSKICGTTGLFIFLIKDALEYAGILNQDKKTPLGRVYQNLNYFVDIEKQKVQKFTKLLEGPFNN